MKTLFASLFFAALLAAQSPRGHWTGTMAVPEQAVDFQVDLDQMGGKWVGSISIPARKASGIPLDKISSSGAKCVFRIQGAPGDPTFNGVIAKDGKSMSGSFVSDGKPIAFQLTLAGDPRVELPKPSPKVPDGFVGEWEGAIELSVRLKIALKLANGPDGATAVLTSIDQGNAQIPVSSISVDGNLLTLDLKAVGGQLTGQLDSAGTTMTGAWRQAGKSLYLSLKKK